MNKSKWKYEFVYIIKNEPEVKYLSGGNKLLLFKIGDFLHNIEFPALIEFYQNGKVKKLMYLVRVVFQRDQYDGKDQPVILTFYENGDIYKKEYMFNYARYREPINGIDQPAILEYYPGNKIKKLIYYYEGKIHRENGPAIVEYNIEGDITSEEYYFENVKKL